MRRRSIIASWPRTVLLIWFLSSRIESRAATANSLSEGVLLSVYELRLMKGNDNQRTCGKQITATPPLPPFLAKCSLQCT